MIEQIAKIIFWFSFFMITYVYLIYPLFLFIWSCFNSKSVKKKDIILDVTLLIAAYNEEEIIEKKIKNSLALDYDPDKLKIVVASDGSTDKTVDLVKKFENKRITLFDYNQRRGKMGTLNATVEHIDSEIIVFSDANTMYKEDAIKKLVRNFYDESVGVVSGNVILEGSEVCFNQPEKIYWQYEHFIQLRESSCNSMLEADGAMYAIRRHLYVSPPDETILDDSVIPMLIAKQGYRIVYDHEALGYEDTSPNLKTEFRRKVRITAGGVQAIKFGSGIPGRKHKLLLFQYISHKLLRWTLPFFFILIFISNIALINKKFYLIIFIIQNLFYATAILGLIFQKKYYKILSTATYFCAVNAAAAVGMVKGILNKQSVRWDKTRRTEQ